MSTYHTSVLLQEAIDFLNIRPLHKYIDATLGGGGHSFEIIERGGRVLGIDTDTDAIEHVKQKFETRSPACNCLRKAMAGRSKLELDERLRLVHGNFRDIERIARENEFETVSGILFDLGVSSYQLDTAARGFSFQKEAALDMRMDPQLGYVTAKDLVNGLSKKELYELFTQFGEERFAHAISNSIIVSRRVKPIETTTELARIIEKVYREKSGAIHPATKAFQALRIAVNDELYSLSEALACALGLLENGGRIVVISFHSLEDKVVKDTFRTFEEKKLGRVLTKKPMEPKEEELVTNRRAKSAKLRVFERIIT